MTSAQLTFPKIFIGLGNPGEKYKGSRHNVGYHFLDLLAEEYMASAFKSESKLFGNLSNASFEGRKVFLFKSSKYMNESGQSVRRFIDYYNLSLEDICIIHDDLDLDCGMAKIKFDGGHGGHNGLRNIIHHCGSAFLRIRIGIGHPQKKDVTDYVLSKPGLEELISIESALVASMKAIGDMANLGVSKAIDILHSN
tara:strand:- start:2405 stop:2992 length:588 start_codon:yes stop_codon:yes gene_type:complete